MSGIGPVIPGANLSAVEFAKLVGRMRGAQDEYFKVRQRPALLRAKRLEAEVDTAIAKILAAAPQGDFV